MTKVVPAILTNDASELLSLVERCEGVVDRIQIDIIDGQFAKNKTIDPAAVEALDTKLLIDFHLMVKEPVNWIERCARAGADRILGHIEMMVNQQDFVEKVQKTGLKSGLALDLPTTTSTLDSGILHDLDAVLVMSVQAGFGGQEFDKKALEKIEKLSKMRDEMHTAYNIIDDGGVTMELVEDAKFAGADEVSVGRRLFDGDLKENIEKMMKASFG